MLTDQNGIGVWFGMYFDFWKQAGETPFWLYFDESFSRSMEVRPLIEPWAKENDILVVNKNSDLAVALRVPYQTEKEGVTRALVDTFASIGRVLEVLKPNTIETITEMPEENDHE